MNGAKILGILKVESIKSRHILFPRLSWSVRFNSNDIHRAVSTQDFEFITKLNSHQIMTLLKSRLIPQSESMLDAVTTNEPTEHRERLYPLLQILYCLVIWFPFFAFFSMKSYGIQIP